MNLSRKSETRTGKMGSNDEIPYFCEKSVLIRGVRMEEYAEIEQASLLRSSLYLQLPRIPIWILLTH